jgi:hypothetical protein
MKNEKLKMENVRSRDFQYRSVLQERKGGRGVIAERGERSPIKDHLVSA